MWLLKLLLYFHPAAVNDSSSAVLFGYYATRAEDLLPTRVRCTDGLSGLHPDSSPRTADMMVEHNEVAVMDPTIAASAARDTDVNADKLRSIGKRAFNVQREAP